MSTPGDLKIAIFDPTKHPSSCLHCHRSYLNSEGICYEEAAAEPIEYWHALCYLSHKLGIPPRDAVPTEENRADRLRAVEAMLPAECRKDAVRYYADLCIGPVCRLKPRTDESEKHYKTLLGVRRGHDSFKLVLKEVRDKMDTVLESEVTPLPTSSWIKKLTPEGKERVLKKGNVLRSHLYDVLSELASREVKKSSIMGGQAHGMIIDVRYVVGLYRKVLEALVVRSSFRLIDQGNADRYVEAIEVAMLAMSKLGTSYMHLCVSVDASASFWSEDTRATCTGDPPEDWLEMYELVKARTKAEDPFIIALMATFWVTARLSRHQIRSTGGGGDGGDDWDLGGLFDEGAD